MTLRVVHACAYFAPAFVYGGPPRSLLGLCQAQLRAGLGVRVITTSANGEAELPEAVISQPEYEGVPVHYCRRTFPRMLFQASTFRDTVARELADADVLHIHGLWNATVWTAAATSREMNVPYVLSTRGMFEPAALRHDRWRKRLAYALRDRDVIGHAALLHATSRKEMTTLQARATHTVKYVPNGIAGGAVPPGGPETFRAQHGIPVDAPIILFLGRIHPLKRLDLLCAAFAGVNQAHPQARLVIAGPDETGLRGQLEHVLGSTRGSVIWTGAVDEPTKWSVIAASRALVLCSDSESFGLSAAEAMAAGRPVVVTRTLPWSEVEARGAGHVVDASAEAIAAALDHLLKNPDEAKAMGQRGREFMADCYSWDRVAAELACAYTDVLRSHRAEA